MKPVLSPNPFIWPAVLGAAMLSVVAPAQPNPGSGPKFVAEFTNPGISPGHWALVIHADGSGHFRSDPSRPTEGEQSAIDPPGQDQDIELSKDYAEHVFQVAEKHKWFNEKCESRLKVAFQGWKKLSYDGPDGHGSCTFNFSQDKEIQELGDSLIGVAETLHEGARLEMLLQHDRLGLDKEMEYLTDGAKDGRLQQIGAIRGILQRLAEDDEVLERVRKRAQLLLSLAGTQSAN